MKTISTILAATGFLVAALVGVTGCGTESDEVGNDQASSVTPLENGRFERDGIVAESTRYSDGTVRGVVTDAKGARLADLQLGRDGRGVIGIAERGVSVALTFKAERIDAVAAQAFSSWALHSGRGDLVQTGKVPYSDTECAGDNSFSCCCTDTGSSVDCTCCGYEGDGVLRCASASQAY